LRARHRGRRGKQDQLTPLSPENDVDSHFVRDRELVVVGAVVVEENKKRRNATRFFNMTRWLTLEGGGFPDDLVPKRGVLSLAHAHPLKPLGPSKIFISTFSLLAGSINHFLRFQWHSNSGLLFFAVRKSLFGCIKIPSFLNHSLSNPL
jgi:hypothetical protein